MKKDYNTKKIISNNYNKNDGITLVALVVTIIVMLILASTAINSLFGEYGLITKAKEAAQAYNHAEMHERNEFNRRD